MLIHPNQSIRVYIGIITTSAGTMRVARNSRNTASRPFQRSLAKAKADVEETISTRIVPTTETNNEFSM